MHRRHIRPYGGQMPRSPRRWALSFSCGLVLVTVPYSAGASAHPARPLVPAAVASWVTASALPAPTSGVEAEDLAPAASALPTTAPARRPLPVPVAIPQPYRTYYPWFIRANLVARGYDSRLGGHYSAQVIDSTGAVVWSRWPNVAYMPASTNKLVTAYVVVTSLGSGSRIATTTHQDPARPWLLYLRGGGDPSLSSTRLGQLADATATAIKAQGRTVVDLRVDDTLFPAPVSSSGWKAGYLPGDVAPVRPLVVDSHNVMDTSMDAAAVFATMLKARGVSARSTARASVPATAGVIGTTSSSTIATLVSQMLNVSQNDYAEILFRLAAGRRGYDTGWTGARANAQALMAASGVPTTGWVVKDGSGLSRDDRLPASTLVGLLRVIDQDPALSGLFFASNALPVAGMTGTLSSRFTTLPTVCARGIVHAKTGSLSDATALAGLAIGVDGERRYFAVVDNYVPNTSSVRAAIDVIAATATGCY